MRFGFAIAGIMLGASFAGAQTTATKVAPKLGWLASWEAAQAEALKSGKPIMVVFRCDP